MLPIHFKNLSNFAKFQDELKNSLLNSDYQDQYSSRCTRKFFRVHETINTRVNINTLMILSIFRKILEIIKFLNFQDNSGWY